MYNKDIKLIKEEEHSRIITADREQLIANFVIAEDLIEKAKKYICKGTIDIKDYNNALKYASKLILESRIPVENTKIE